MNTLRGFVPRMGVEPTRPNGHMALNHACLPIPAPGQMLISYIKKAPGRSFSDSAGARTQDPLLKREMLYQLSYQVSNYAVSHRGCKYNINNLFFNPK